jgi:hypothetical protein
MLIDFTRVRRTAVILFWGLSAFYLSLSPTSIAGQGYTGEEINSGLRMLAVINAWVKGRPVPPMEWSRHGPVPVLFDLPFIQVRQNVCLSGFHAVVSARVDNRGLRLESRPV